MTDTPTWRSWQKMMARCYHETDEHYPQWGGRGITVCKEWHDFSRFLRDMGFRPKGMTIGRKNHDLGYSKENCEWQTQLQQNRNRRDARTVTWKGTTLCLSEWADKLGIRLGTLSSRYYKGYPTDRLFAPIESA